MWPNVLFKTIYLGHMPRFRIIVQIGCSCQWLLLPIAMLQCRKVSVYSNTSIVFKMSFLVCVYTPKQNTKHFLSYQISQYCKVIALCFDFHFFNTNLFFSINFIGHFFFCALPILILNQFPTGIFIVLLSWKYTILRILNLSYMYYKYVS